MRPKVAVRLILAATACALAAPTFAHGAANSAKTKVKITEGGPTLFAGKVSSKEAKCEKRRKVTLHYEFGGPYGRAGDVVGTARTDASGAWEIEGSFVAGLYYASVTEKTRGDFLCKAGRGLQAQFRSSAARDSRTDTEVGRTRMTPRDDGFGH